MADPKQVAEIRAFVHRIQDTVIKSVHNRNGILMPSADSADLDDALTDLVIRVMQRDGGTIESAYNTLTTTKPSLIELSPAKSSAEIFADLTTPGVTFSKLQEDLGIPVESRIRGNLAADQIKQLQTMMSSFTSDSEISQQEILQLQHFFIHTAKDVAPTPPNTGSNQPKPEGPAK